MISEICFKITWEARRQWLALSYSGGRDQEDRGSKPAEVNSSRDPILKISNIKTGLVEWIKLVECLPSKCETLSSNSNTNKNKNKVT
jgi:hypothetical protein